MRLEARCQTTAMGIMPHEDIDRALELALALDIPFWPQLPHVSLYEDMYVQASEKFPGISVDMETGKITLDSTRFTEELVHYSERMMEPNTFRLTEVYSVVYHHFLKQPLSDYTAIRGQQIGPVSFGFKVVDEDNRPIIYNEEIRTILYDFMQRKANIQYIELSEKNPNAFVWLDEPGLGWVFSGLTGYDDVRARQDYGQFLSGLEGPPALHLCANVNLPYLLSLGIEILSFDAYQIEFMPREYSRSIAGFLASDGIISWGIVPVDSQSFSMETPVTLADRLSGYWGVVSDNSSVSSKQVAERALVAPARCCLKDIGAVGAPGEQGKSTATSGGEEQLVEKAFDYLSEISRLLQSRYNL
ncbi:MAG: hypothetical protein JSV77_10600 [Dehalococcoidales bacterium]|nr:MAG: hypothetical protein JSV77_10600 [Dehalococcoidales bacterium]